MRLSPVLVLATLWVAASLASAHDVALTGVRVLVQSKRTIVTVTTHRTALQKEGNPSMDLGVRQELSLVVDDRPFRPTTATVVEDPANDLVTWQAILPYPGHTFSLGHRFYEQDPTARTILSIQRPGQATEEILLEPRDNATTSANTGVLPLRFVVQGVEHILSGPDHILFVLGLILLGGRLRTTLKTVTAFTVAHCLTLVLAVTGTVNPPSRWVECLIAASIIAIAFENLRRTPGQRSDHRPKVAFLFGLFHGFGFSGALANVGLRGFDLAGALASFNVGVELGQAAIILTVVPTVRLITKAYPSGWQKIATAGSVAIGLMGSYWFFERLVV